jgi:hypothetical protein
MSVGRKALEGVWNDLSRGYARMALLGSSSQNELRLDSPESLARYADMVRPNITAALKRNQSVEWLIHALLGALFATAIVLTILANVWGWGWKAAAGTIPGLGVTAAWPISTLMRLRRENLKLSLVIEFLPLLPPKDAATIVKDLFLKDG